MKRSSNHINDDADITDTDHIMYDPNGPFEEHPYKDESNEEDEGEGKEEEGVDGEAEDDEEDIFALPRALLDFSRSSKCRIKAANAVDKASTVLLTLYPKLSSTIQKAKARNDGKVAPGSNDVKRNFEDIRYLMHLIYIEIGRHKEIDGKFEEAKEKFQEAIICFPRSIEANYRLAKIEKAFACSEQELANVEKYLKKATSSFKSMNDERYVDVNLDNRSLQEVEHSIGVKAIDALILFLCQQGRVDEAHSLLAMQCYTHRLSDQILCYREDLEQQLIALKAHENQTSNLPIVPAKIIEEAITLDMLKCLENVFREDGPFWKEHEYDVMCNSSRTSGYFSYLYPFRERVASNAIEQIINVIYDTVCAQYPLVKSDCKYIEWWVHLRPHSNGHQLHFDSDETAIEGGKLPMHPIASSVLFISDSIGGPTLVTNQVLNGPLATEGWLVPPKRNRLVTFDAKYLHGVVPGKGLTAQPTDRRLTFMVGFWRENFCAQPKGIDVMGAGQPFPSVESRYKWINEVPLTASFSSPHEWMPTVVELIPVPINSIWQEVGRITGTETALEVDDSSNVMSGKHSLKRSFTGQLPDYDKCFQGF